MSHELHISEGKAAMMYVGGPPWHGLGTRLDKPATSREAIRAAGLDWKVKLVPVHAGDDKAVVKVPSRHAVVREDLWGSADCPVLGVVAQGYVPLQNDEAFEFFDSIVGKNADIYHTAGALGQGERVWILAKLPGQMHIVRNDIADKFLLLSTGHDGRTSVQIKFTPVRVVCQNTLTLALRKGPQISIAHDRRLHQGLHDAKSLLGDLDRQYAEMENTFRRMARVPVSASRLSQYMETVFAMPNKEPHPRTRRRVLLDREAGHQLFECGRGQNQPGVRGTLWAAYNAVTEYVDHHRCGYSAERRLRSVCFGRGHQIKQTAYHAANQLMQSWANEVTRPTRTLLTTQLGQKGIEARNNEQQSDRSSAVAEGRHTRHTEAQRPMA